MFDFVNKKKQVKPGTPPKKDKDGEEIEVEIPDVEGTLSDLDAALKAADNEREKGTKEKIRKEQRALMKALEKRPASSCGCG